MLSHYQQTKSVWHCTALPIYLLQSKACLDSPKSALSHSSHATGQLNSRGSFSLKLPGSAKCHHVVSQIGFSVIFVLFYCQRGSCCKRKWQLVAAELDMAANPSQGKAAIIFMLYFAQKINNTRWKHLDRLHIQSEDPHCRPATSE